ncbi:hypothetical protein BHM03_00002141 [Ensete ventricosum]|uniref:Uncharacterized protein n=1 Tax=Ensete ventricosum TaxID=4639 RepID=A0A445M9I6_ENSVE|nr:hypothetical protein BHM03_00002141 [Ensete ventricosum]
MDNTSCYECKKPRHSEDEKRNQKEVENLTLMSINNEEFAKGIGKLARNTPGDRRKKTVRLTARMPEAAGLARVQVRIRKVEGTTFLEIMAVELPVSDGCTIVAQVFGWLTTIELPIPYFKGAFSGCTVSVSG